MSNWSFLPNELLSCIFNQLDNDTERSNTSDIKACQLVCKNWGRAAQEILYQHVDINPRNGPQFSNAITQAQDIGLLVKRLSFAGFSNGNNQQSRDIMRAICQYCPNIRELQVGTQEGSRDILPLLVSDENNIKGLEKLTFPFDEIWILVDARLYEAIVLKYRKSMKQLDIANSRLSPTYRELETKIHMFSSLKQLRIHKYHFIDGQEMNQMLDRCSSSLQQLEVIRWDSRGDFDIRPQDTVVNPNIDIKKLKISSAQVNLATLHYFDLKFRALEDLQLQNITPVWTSAEAAIEWWQHLTNISLKLKQYTYRLWYAERSEQNEKLDQLKHYLDILQKTSIEGCQRHLTLKYNLLYGCDQDILMAKTPKSCQLELYQETVDDFPFFGIVGLLQLYSTDSIILASDNVSLLYNSLGFFASEGKLILDESIDLNGLAYDFCPSSEIQDALRSTFVDVDSYWTALNHALAILGPNKRQDVCIEYAIIFEQQPLVDLGNKKASNVSFKKCILEHSVLSYISQAVVEIEYLLFDTTTVLMDEPYNLNIYLPATSIHTLKLMIAPLVNEYITNFPENYDYHDCRVENKQLLDAFSPTGHYTLKIETENKTYISKRQGGLIIEEDCADVAIGTQDNFLVWIKCKDLNQFLVTCDPLSNDFESLN